MFSDYATELSTPAGTLTIMGENIPVPFDKDVLCKNKAGSITCIDLHIDLNLMRPGTAYACYVNKSPLKGWKQTDDVAIWLGSIDAGYTMAITVLGPERASNAFTVIGEPCDFSLAGAGQEDSSLSIIANEPKPDTYLQVMVAWGRTDTLAELALQYVIANRR